MQGEVSIGHLIGQSCSDIAVEGGDRENSQTAWSSCEAVELYKQAQ